MSKPPSKNQFKMSAEVQAFAARLVSRQAEVRQEAKQEILSLGAKGRDILVCIMRNEGQYRVLRRRSVYVLYAVGPIVWATGLALIALNSSWHTARGFVLILVLQWVLFALSVWAANYNYANAAGLLATYFEDVTLIGPMAEALDYKRKSVRNIAAETLVRLLPLLHEEDSNILTPAGRINLRRALLGSNAELVFATLGALDQVGDTEAIPYVRKLVSGAGLAGNDNRIQTAAQQTLFHLSALVEAQRAPQTLLRAASLLEGANEMLLRGAASTGDVHEHDLPRPACVADDIKVALETGHPTEVPASSSSAGAQYGQAVTTVEQIQSSL